MYNHAIMTFQNNGCCGCSCEQCWMQKTYHQSFGLPYCATIFATRSLLRFPLGQDKLNCNSGLPDSFQNAYVLDGELTFDWETVSSIALHPINSGRKPVWEVIQCNVHNQIGEFNINHVWLLVLGTNMVCRLLFQHSIKTVAWLKHQLLKLKFRE